MDRVENTTTIPVDDSDEDESVEVLTDDEGNEDDSQDDAGRKDIEDNSHDGDAAGHKVNDPAFLPTGAIPQ
jgi:hypothetical protein